MNVIVKIFKVGDKITLDVDENSEIVKGEEESNNYKEPDWVIKDVTSDKNYKNGYLARYGIPKE